jgi:hypothetical protein
MISFTPLDASRALEALLMEAFNGRETAPKAADKNAVAALTFVPLDDICRRTISSTGDLTKVQPDDATR